MARYRPLIIVLLLFGVVCAAQNLHPNISSYTSKGRPSHPAWAKHLTEPGLKNFCKVNDRLYRGAQPTREGCERLGAMGIKTVINLRDLHSDGEKLEGTGIVYDHIHFKTWHPEDDEVVRFLKIVTDKDKGPFFVHCHHGSDRTGMMCAIYRVAVDGWSKDEAIDEMVKGGYGFHPVWQNLIHYIRNLDIEKIKKEAGIEGKKP